MGNHATPLAELSFDEVPVPKANLLGTPGKGLKVALAGLARGRCAVSFAAIGLARASLDAAVRYAKERKQFGKPIASSWCRRSVGGECRRWPSVAPDGVPRRRGARGRQEGAA